MEKELLKSLYILQRVALFIAVFKYGLSIAEFL